MHRVRLLADDLTGALDTAAEFVGLTGGQPLLAFWHGALPDTLPAHAAIDSGTREQGPEAARAIVTRLAPCLAGATLAYKKIDSLLRGPTLAEIAACFRAGRWTHALLAPAFPYQGRATLGGVQHVRASDGTWSPLLGGDLVAGLRAEGVPVQAAHPGQVPAPGITVFDAETDADLRRVAALERALPEPVLWIGTGGLAQALGALETAGPEPLPSPVLGLFGSDQTATAAQLAACGADWLRLRNGSAAEAQSVAVRLRGTGRALASLELPPGLSREDAAERIADGLRRLVDGLPPPGTLLVAGGETLRGLCLALAADALELRGRIVPGLPRSTLRGGRWDGVTVVSKSGAFGPPNLLRDLALGRLPGARQTEPERTT